MFSDDGRRALTYSWRSQEARLWDALTGKELAVFSFLYPVNDGVLSPDGTRVAVATEDATVCIWTLLPSGQTLIDLGRRLTGRELTDGERAEFFVTEQALPGATS
jgi:WD40 repeat protein